MRALLVGALALCTLPVFAQGRWKIQLFYDKDNSALEFTDLQCPSATTCIASAVMDEKNRRRGTIVRTTDGGAHWSYVPVADLPVALFFLNDKLGWMAGEEGIWSTQDSGQTWKRIKKISRIERVFFLDEKHGWAVGSPKAVYQTTDGGVTWERSAASDAGQSAPESTVYDWVVFESPKHGYIVGAVNTPGIQADTPDWMDPEEAEQSYRAARSRDVFLETNDGGATWQSWTSKTRGALTNVRLAPNGSALAIFQRRHTNDAAGKVAKVDLQEHTVTPAYTEHPAYDVIVLPSGAAVTAAINVLGRSKELPIPAKLELLYSEDWVTWQPMKVDYKAVARNVVLAGVDGQHMWAATDTGMILGFVPGAAK